MNIAGKEEFPAWPDAPTEKGVGISFWARLSGPQVTALLLHAHGGSVPQAPSQCPVIPALDLTPPGIGFIEWAQTIRHFLGGTCGQWARTRLASTCLKALLPSAHRKHYSDVLTVLKQTSAQHQSFQNHSQVTMAMSIIPAEQDMNQELKIAYRMDARVGLDSGSAQCCSQMSGCRGIC